MFLPARKFDYIKENSPLTLAVQRFNRHSIFSPGQGFEHVLQELPGGASVCFFNELGCVELTRAVDADKEIELSLCRLDFSDINMEEADGVALELLALRLVPLDFRQARDAMPLQAVMQSRPRQMWDRGLQSICGIEGCKA